VTDFQVGPDGALYVLGLGGTLYRIVPEPGAGVALSGLVALGLLRRESRRAPRTG